MVEKPVGVTNTPINQLFHLRRAADATDTNHSSSATDFLYTVSWYDVRREPVVISVPDSGDRYYSVQFMEWYSDIFAYVGTRATGGKAGSYLLVDCRLERRNPGGHRRRHPRADADRCSADPVGFRNDRSKLAPVHKMQDASDMRPLSKWLARDTSPSTQRDVVDPATSRLALGFLCQPQPGHDRKPAARKGSGDCLSLAQCWPWPGAKR